MLADTPDPSPFSDLSPRWFRTLHCFSTDAGRWWVGTHGTELAEPGFLRRVLAAEHAVRSVSPGRGANPSERE